MTNYTKRVGQGKKTITIGEKPNVTQEQLQAEMSFLKRWQQTKSLQSAPYNLQPPEVQNAMDLELARRFVFDHISNQEDKKKIILAAEAIRDSTPSFAAVSVEKRLSMLQKEIDDDNTPRAHTNSQYHSLAVKLVDLLADGNSNFAQKIRENEMLKRQLIDMLTESYMQNPGLVQKYFGVSGDATSTRER